MSCLLTRNLSLPCFDSPAWENCSLGQFITTHCQRMGRMMVSAGWEGEKERPTVSTKARGLKQQRGWGMLKPYGPYAAQL